MPLSGAFEKQEIFHLPPQTQAGDLYTVYIFVISLKVSVNTIGIGSGSSELEDWFASVPLLPLGAVDVQIALTESHF